MKKSELLQRMRMKVNRVLRGMKSYIQKKNRDLDMLEVEVKQAELEEIEEKQ